MTERTGPFFLRCPLAGLGEMAKGYEWGLMMVKVAPSSGAYVAFQTADLAREFLSTRRSPYDISVISALELSDRVYANFDTSTVLMFESWPELENYRANPAAYPFEKHTFRYDKQTGSLQVAV